MCAPESSSQSVAARPGLTARDATQRFVTVTPAFRVRVSPVSLTLSNGPVSAARSTSWVGELSRK